MKKMTLKSDYVTKAYSRKTIFRDVSFSVNEGSAFAITGKNGSGKSTLIKILCGLLTPTKGSVLLSVNEKTITPENYYPHIGLVSPYLNLYEEFTGEENLLLIKKIRGLNSGSDARINELLNEFNIYDHRKKEVRFYSSGMKQRLKYCAALLHKPVILYLDEPSANLDEMGIGIVRDAMNSEPATR
ncbi:MAG: ABC transporter ATP-binding protein [Ignavibacteriales bacterium]|nr:ABC transporter ATP-binding protein [Ignavibacteriales bacterium]